MQVNPYLNFDGNAEEAMRFYAGALGGTLTAIHRYEMMPGMPMPDDLKRRVMHVGINLPGGATIMGSDTFPGMGPPYATGTAFHVSLHPGSRAAADAVFAALSAGGTVTMPLAEQFWGDYFGSITDRYGVQWMVLCASKV